jgi:hypothetical protein
LVEHGPQISQCTNSKLLEDLCELLGKGSLCCLARGQMQQGEVLFISKLSLTTGSLINFIRESDI